MGKILDEQPPNPLKQTKAIVTKYFGPTNYKGSRIKATLAGDRFPEEQTPVSVTVPFDYSTNHGQDAHAPAVLALLDKLARSEWGRYGWDKTKVESVSYLGEGSYCFNVSLI